MFVVFGASSASALNYDCTKVGNANKAACKGAASAPAKAKAASAAPAARSYDCTKAGNANKAACKGVASAPAPAKAAAAVPAVRTYDCSKAGNANKAACKGMESANVASRPAAGAPTGPKPVSAVLTKAPPAQAGKSTAQCKDGTYSASQHRTGTCSRHGGVANWLANIQ